MVFMPRDSERQSIDMINRMRKANADNDSKIRYFTLTQYGEEPLPTSGKGSWITARVIITGILVALCIYLDQSGKSFFALPADTVFHWLSADYEETVIETISSLIKNP